MANSRAQPREVVVIVSPEYLSNKDARTFAARIRPLGLTAYGSSREEASAKVKRMFASAVETRRRRGTLTRWLNKSNVEWRWLDEYRGNVRIERAGQETAESPSPSSRWEEYKGSELEMGVAA